MTVQLSTEAEGVETGVGTLLASRNTQSPCLLVHFQCVPGCAYTVFGSELYTWVIGGVLDDTQQLMLGSIFFLASHSVFPAWAALPQGLLVLWLMWHDASASPMVCLTHHSPATFTH